MTTLASSSHSRPAIIIGLVGTERSGKDTIADYLITNHNFKKHNMADPIRAIAKQLFNWTESQLTGAQKDIPDPDTGIKPRDFFTWFGTDICQFSIYDRFPQLAGNVKPRTIWTRAMHAFISQNSRAHNIVIPDIRFKHEADALLDAGGIIVHISNRDRDTFDQLGKYELAELQTEKKYNAGGYKLDNNGDIASLFRNIDDLIILMSSSLSNLSVSGQPFDTSNISLFI